MGISLSKQASVLQEALETVVVKSAAGSTMWPKKLVGAKLMPVAYLDEDGTPTLTGLTHEWSTFGGQAPKKVMRAGLYVVVVAKGDGDLPENWEKQVIFLPIARQWASALLDTLGDADQDLTMGTVDPEGKLDPGNIFKLTRQGKAYVFSPLPKAKYEGETQLEPPLPLNDRCADYAAWQDSRYPEASGQEGADDGEIEL